MIGRFEINLQLYSKVLLRVDFDFRIRFTVANYVFPKILGILNT